MSLSKYTGLLLLLSPFIAFALVKPIKILIPEIAEVKCVESWLCLDDISKLEAASALYEASLNDVEATLTAFNKKPKVVFCATQSCFSKFGFNKEAANSIGSFGVVIAPRGWERHYITHEIIHQWQSETFGCISTWLAPKWVTEGMAYSLSNDPREVLTEPFQAYREQYNRMFGHLEGHQLIIALSNEMWILHKAFNQDGLKATSP